MKQYDTLVKDEYNRIKQIFEGTDEKQLELLEGTLIEAARLRVELNKLYEIIRETGLLIVKDGKPNLQKELPVSKMVVKVRANYLNYIAKLSNILGRTVDEDEYDLEDYE